jgi:WD40 repeat protein/serine/threonine protein kinase
VGERIGEGGFGAVYRCEQLELERQAVIKVLHERRSRAVDRARFMREAKLASHLRHHYAAHIYSYGAERDGVQWIAMELVPGLTFEAWLKLNGPMALEQFVPFFEKVAEVVAAAHDSGIIHRDLKPSNVMVVEIDGVMIPKLLDWGIAKLASPLGPPEKWADGSPGESRERSTISLEHARPLTRSSAGIGSAPYMSPEQWICPSEVGPASDIYSLGVVAYRALTGVVPFAGETTDDYCRMHCHARVRALGPGFPRALDQAIQRALNKAPDQRQSSVRELAAELRAALQASEQELLRASARQWEAGARAHGLLWGRDMLACFESWTRRISWPALSDQEVAFIAASQRRARRSTWSKRILAMLAMSAVFGLLLLLQTESQDRARAAERLLVQSEAEQGRQDLRDNGPEARRHLAAAYNGGDHSPGLKFMLARALQSQRSELARFSSQSGRMWSAAFSPDSKTIVTTDDHAAQVWDAARYRLLFTASHADIVYDAIYSGDGRTLYTASGDGTVGVWDAATGAPVRKLSREGRRIRYDLLATSPDRRFVAAIDTRGEAVHVWNTDTGASLAELPNDGSGLPAIAFSSDSRWLVATGGDDLRVFDVQTWQKVLAIPHVRRMSLDPTSPRVATGNTEGDFSIWELPSGTRIRHLREVGEAIDRVAFSPDGGLVVTAAADGAEQIWNATTGGLQAQLNVRKGRCYAIEFDHSSHLVLSAFADGTVVIADVTQGVPISMLEGAESAVRAAHFESNSHRIVAASSDGTARIWDAAAPYFRWGGGPTGKICSDPMEPDRRFVAIACPGAPTRVWDTVRGQLLAELPSVIEMDDGAWNSTSSAVSAAGDRAAIARNHAVEIYEVPSGRLLQVVRHDAGVNVVAFARDGRDLVSGDIEGTLLLTRDGQAPIALQSATRGTRGIDAALVSANHIVAVDASKHLRVYDRRTSAMLADLEVSTRVLALRASHDGTRVISLPAFALSGQVGKTAAADLWDLEHYRFIAALGSHRGPTFSARFMAEDREVVTAGGDGTVRRWDAASGRSIQTYRGSPTLLGDAMLSSDRAVIVAGGADGVLHFWDSRSGRPLWTMPASKSPIVAIHRQGDDIITFGFRGEISGWRLPDADHVIDADQVIEGTLKPELWFRDEADHPDSETPASP